ncbi:VanW family protein [Deinococcus sp. QL22]|uniref:VanW family protein n=1 Tax=Deinococcus sp. QL22 TaxID=2939437 RepID=UPI002017E568|nr:VanW family protein [Deinococcus sp. QL22]UQN07525.1 VanW family protein [Deinococcus sp. QL22]
MSAVLGAALLGGAVAQTAAQIDTPPIAVPPVAQPTPTPPAAPAPIVIPVLPLPPTPPGVTPPAPPPIPVPPVEVPPEVVPPAPPTEPMPEPVPTPPADPAQPAPTPPEPSVKVTPPRTAPLLITVRAEWPALVDGKKTTLPFTRTLTVSAARVTQLRQRGGSISASLEADLKKFVADLPSKPENARFEELWDGWSIVQRNGLIINMDKTRASIETVLKNPQGVQASVIVSGQVAPERTLNFFVSRGITQHLGTGETNYYGSSPARVTNIHVGASRFKDRLIEGKVFSFNQAVGAINTQNGFVTGLVISGERTVDGVGGGICQVSTTVFRTLYGAGLTATQRQNHSYQVRYYDPSGLDAAVYQPTLDLKFANDTGGALWFQTDWNDEEARLSIAVFGKARDYTVEVGTPRTLATRASPVDRLISDSTLPAGQRKQVDWAAPGATLEVTRKFIRNGQTFKQDTLRSVYRPWPNIFLVGTRR